MDLINYRLSEYEEYLMERTGTENVMFDCATVYVTYHRNNNSTELMKTNDDEFVALCIESKERTSSLQKSGTDDSSKWLESIRFPVDSTEIDEFEKLFYEQNPDILPQPKNNPLSGSKVTLPLGEALFEFIYADFDSLYKEVEVSLCIYSDKNIELPDVDSDVQDLINRFQIYRSYNWLINHLAFGSTASALFPPAIREDADLPTAMIDYYHYLITLQKEYRDILEFCFEPNYYPEVLGDMNEFLGLELNKLIEYDIKLKCCQRCGWWFTYKGNYDARYCNRVHTGELRSCRDLAAEENYKEKMEKDEALLIYRKYYRRYSARVKVNQIKENDFLKWKYKALAKRNECSAEKITAKEYSEWMEGCFPNRKKKVE